MDQYGDGYGYDGHSYDVPAGDANGYGVPAGYGVPGYGVPAGYGVPTGDVAGYGVPGPEAGYGVPGVEVPGYGVPAGYGVPGADVAGYGVPGADVQGYGVPAGHGTDFDPYAAQTGYGTDYNALGIPGYDANPMGLPSVEDLNQMANQSYAQTSSVLDSQVAQMNAQYEWYGQNIDAMNADGRYDALLAQADRADAQMAQGYQQYNNGLMAQTNAESWDQADAQAYWTRQNL